MEPPTAYRPQYLYVSLCQQEYDRRLTLARTPLESPRHGSDCLRWVLLDRLPSKPLLLFPWQNCGLSCIVAERDWMRLPRGKSNCDYLESMRSHNVLPG
ncbi:hypothetical protein GMOD_00000011 [Pyrenophora seminiperda CCB06]|uniref:Uncharacterized protein n=1 Tax=Pyrenophora seminiperda CCB06 TaxID=1302712 RepID=A0A3M7M6A4_9PLEO|nr:hypothetical protein GMOD_00000011 [Pyrenophora seminiperda CCB06]